MNSRDRSGWPSSVVAVDLPAHPDFVASVRAMTRSMAVLADMTLDDVEELQMAVDEAAILLLPLVDAGEPELHAVFEIEDGGLSIALSGCRADGAEVDRAGLPWMMLSALDPEAAVTARDDEIGIRIHRRRRSPHP